MVECPPWIDRSFWDAQSMHVRLNMLQVAAALNGSPSGMAEVAERRGLPAQTPWIVGPIDSDDIVTLATQVAQQIETERSEMFRREAEMKRLQATCDHPEIAYAVGESGTQYGQCQKCHLLMSAPPLPVSSPSEVLRVGSEEHKGRSLQ